MRPTVMESCCICHKQKGPYNQAGRTTYKGRMVALHRLIFFKEFGYWPEVVLHLCDNQRCINPEHLVGGTQSDNIRDAVEKGRWVRNFPNKLSADTVRAIRSAVGTNKQIAHQFNIDPAHVSRIKNGIAYKEVT